MTDQAAPPQPPERIAFAEGCACFTLRKAARAVTQMFDAHLRPSGLRATQFTLLVAVSSFGPISMQPLADRLGMDRTTLNRNLNPLLRDGLVTITPGADRRSKQVGLTAAGHARAVAAIPLWRNAQQAAVARLGPEHWRVLRPILQNFAGQQDPAGTLPE